MTMRARLLLQHGCQSLVATETWERYAAQRGSASQSVMWPRHCCHRRCCAPGVSDLRSPTDEDDKYQRLYVSEQAASSTQGPGYAGGNVGHACRVFLVGYGGLLLPTSSLLMQLLMALELLLLVL